MQRVTGQQGTINRQAPSVPVVPGILLLALALLAAACGGDPLAGTVPVVDLVASLPRAEAWGPVELIDLGTGEHKLNLIDGLYFAEREPDGRTYAWSWGDETSILLTCPAVRPRALSVTCRRLDVEPLEDLEVSVRLNGELLGVFTPGTDYADEVFETPPDLWKPGDNLFSLRYSEDVFLPDVIPGIRDTRSVAVQLDAVRILADRDRGPEPVPVTAADGRVSFPLPADAAWYLEVSEGGLLTFGAEAGAAAELVITAAADDEPAAELFRRRYRAGARKEAVAVDLGAWAGRFIRLAVSVDAARNGSGDGCFHLLAPEIRAPGAEAARPAERPSLQPGATAAAGRRPNILVYLLDALRAENLSAYGYHRRTSPVIDRLSRQGLLFRAAFSQAPNTVPSVTSLLTGRYLPFTGYGAVPDELPTLAEVFSRAGYATGFFSNNPNLGGARGYFRGFDHVGEEVFFRSKPVKDFAGLATDAFIDWAGGLPPEQPFFTYVHTIHPHNPYEAPEPFGGVFLPPGSERASVDLSTEALLDYVHGERELTGATLRRMRDFYDGDILYNDLQLGRLLAWLRQAGRGDDTAIFITADHGEELADHGGLLHGYTLYDEQIHVPLLIVPPQAAAGPLPAGRRVSGMVQLVDLAPTLFDLGRVKDPPPTEGNSLTGHFTDDPAAGAVHGTVFSSASSAYGLFTLRTGRWKYVFAPRSRHTWGMGEGLGRTRRLHYLFDLEADPGETENLVDERQITRKALQARLLDWVDEQRAADEAAGERREAPELDEETRQRLLDLGYMTE